MTERAYWTADQYLTGGYPCAHRHRTRKAAERCLPGLPTGPGTRGTFSMAEVRPGNEAAREIDRAAEEESDWIGEEEKAQTAADLRDMGYDA